MLPHSRIEEKTKQMCGSLTFGFKKLVTCYVSRFVLFLISFFFKSHKYISFNDECLATQNYRGEAKCIYLFDDNTQDTTVPHYKL